MVDSGYIDGDENIGSLANGENTKIGVFSCKVTVCSGATEYYSIKARVTHWQLERSGIAPSLILYGQQDVRVSSYKIKSVFNVFNIDNTNYQKFNHFSGKQSLGDTLYGIAND